jgi:hypothetical protein
MANVTLIDPSGRPEIDLGIGVANNVSLRAAIGDLDTKITAPTSPGTDDVLVWNGSAWVSQKLDTDNFADSAWSTYTPTAAVGGSAITLGNGTIEGRFRKVMRIAHVSVRLTIGSTTSYGTGQWSWSLPSGNNMFYDRYHAVGVGSFLDSSLSNVWELVVRARTDAADATTVIAADVTSGNLLTDTIPVAAASGDIFGIQLTYETAS